MNEKIIYAITRSKPARWAEHYFLVECDRADTPESRQLD